MQFSLQHLHFGSSALNVNTALQLWVDPLSCTFEHPLIVGPDGHAKVAAVGSGFNLTKI
jgi:hypothetical protein